MTILKIKLGIDARNCSRVLEISIWCKCEECYKAGLVQESGTHEGLDHRQLAAGTTSWL